MIDAVIPAAYSAILLLGVTLYNISLLVLLLSFCITIGIICYIAFIYNPVLAAYSHRSPVPSQMDEGAIIFNNRTRRYQNITVKAARGPEGSLQNICSYMRRVSNKMLYAAEYVVTKFSYQRLRTRVARQVVCERKWCHLNMPSISQGIISAKGGEVTISLKGSRKSVMVNSRNKRDMFNLNNKRYNPPLQIRNMMIASPKGKEFNCYQGSVFDDLTDAETLGRPHEFIIQVSKKITESSKKLKPLILFDAKDALVRMRSQLLIGSSGPWDIYDYFDVSEFELSSAFQDIFDSFYPDGIAMSKEEKAEADELFSEWKTRQNIHFKLETVGKRVKKRRMISFHLFEEWFMGDLMSAIHNIVSERLMAHTFKFRPINRIKGVYETSPHPFDINYALNIKDKGRLNMKALEMVTAHTLSASRHANCSPSSNVKNPLVFLSSNMKANSNTSTRFILEHQSDTNTGTIETSSSTSTSTSTATPGCLGEIFCHPEYSL